MRPKSTVLRERDLSGAQAAGTAGVTEADISRIRRADLNRFTIDRLVRILNRLDSRVQVAIRLRRRESRIEDKIEARSRSRCEGGNGLGILALTPLERTLGWVSLRSSDGVGPRRASRLRTAHG